MAEYETQAMLYNRRTADGKGYIEAHAVTHHRTASSTTSLGKCGLCYTTDERHTMRKAGEEYRQRRDAIRKKRGNTKPRGINKGQEPDDEDAATSSRSPIISTTSNASLLRRRLSLSCQSATFLMLLNTTPTSTPLMAYRK